ncbi:hypothetical protein [Anatilimnocola floriformis]|uniref:hypothetical protein n=1 Tax=Anatilimnocola floriformis TaxID=2948575 RepID=UPI0020C2E557|nr:hypothetical protein [Anatilimnocola floriformis]
MSIFSAEVCRKFKQEIEAGLPLTPVDGRHWTLGEFLVLQGILQSYISNRRSIPEEDFCVLIQETSQPVSLEQAAAKAAAKCREMYPGYFQDKRFFALLNPAIFPQYETQRISPWEMVYLAGNPDNRQGDIPGDATRFWNSIGVAEKPSVEFLLSFVEAITA